MPRRGATYMISVLQPARAIVDPVDGIPAAVQSRRWVWPLLLLMAATSFSGVAFALRWQAGPAVISELSAEGDLERTTEKELEDKVRTRGRVALVAGAAKGVFLIPVLVLLGAAFVKFSGWLVARPVPFVAGLSALCLASLPISVFHLAYGVVALSTAQLSLAQAPDLLPSHLGHFLTGLSPELARLASVADAFNLWAAALLGLGLAQGAGLSRLKGLFWGFGLYLLYAGVFLVGLPGLGGGK